ncbi:MAG TPA: hypothetical protein VL913_00510 [Candidatus Micrarchaeaceae archaeon]|nr:hypothetical protein [Candidatus Micrarchaeaceae archaeon]
MKKKSGLRCGAIRWRGRQAVVIGNEAIALEWLLGGGHLASVKAHSAEGDSPNFLFEAPWKTIEPYRYSAKKHSRIYSPPPEGSYLAGYTGHVICLDFFGVPTREETRAGLPLHGELASRRWIAAQKKVSRGSARLVLRGSAPIARLRFEREVVVHEGEPAAYVTETVTNALKFDRFVQWVQHATFGPPFFKENESVCVMPAARCRTGPYEYEGSPALPVNQDFAWPLAPDYTGGEHDVSKPFAVPGRGFVATVLLDQSVPVAYMAVLNWRLGRVFGYCFRSADYPWVVFWEENKVRKPAPWNGTTQARGLEFGNTPTPEGMQESVLAGRLFDVPRLTRLPAAGRLTIPYVMFTAAVPNSWRMVTRIEARGGKIILTESDGAPKVEIPARDVDQLLAPPAK